MADFGKGEEGDSRRPRGRSGHSGQKNVGQQSQAGSRLARGSAPAGPSGLAVPQLFPVPGNCFISVHDEVLINLIETFQQPVPLLLRTLRREQWLLTEREAVPLGTHTGPPSIVNTLWEN